MLIAFGTIQLWMELLYAIDKLNSS